MQRLEFPLDGISVAGTVVDLETVGLEPVAGGIFTFGYLSEDVIRIVQAEGESDCVELERFIRDVWETLPRPLYAYNKGFEEKWFRPLLGSKVHVDHDLMETWKRAAEQQSLKWPRLRELVRPPVFYYRWGVADLDRERDPAKLRQAIRRASSVNEVMSREAVVGAPHVWWQQHLEAMQDSQILQELSRLSRGETGYHSQSVYRLPNGNWTTMWLAAIICHNMMDLQSEASLLLWPWDVMSQWR